MKRKEINVVTEELKERLTAKKMAKQYGDGCKKFRQNKLFQNKQKRLFEELQEKV